MVVPMTMRRRPFFRFSRRQRCFDTHQSMIAGQRGDISTSPDHAVTVFIWRAGKGYRSRDLVRLRRREHARFEEIGSHGATAKTSHLVTC